MKNSNSSPSQVLNITVGIIICIAISLLIYWQVLQIDELTNTPTNTPTYKSSKTADNEPIYWVAPMDPNFKRDKAGKSPMGMDLVPVYANNSSQDPVGTVTIDPTTVQNLGVKTTLVSYMSPFVDIRAFGQVEYAQDLMVHIHARVEGWVETLHVRSLGEFIEKDAPLYELYSPELVNAQEELLIAFKQGNASLIKAAQSRLEALNVPDLLINNIKRNHKVQRTVTFTAPQSGFINNLQIQEGFFVTPSKTMLSIAPLDKVWVVANLFAQQASLVEVGQTAFIKSDFVAGNTLADTLKSQIDYIYPSLNPKTKTLQVRFSVPNTKLSLKPDMYVDVLINTQKSSSKAQVLAVPAQAVIRTGTHDRIVIALGEGKFKSVEVSIGRLIGNHYEITEGLYENDRIVTSAQFLLDSESSITSDFNRMNDFKEDTTLNTTDSHNNISAWTSATVNKVINNERIINLTHGSLDAFNMMGMTMDFMVATKLDISQFKAGQKVHVEIVKTTLGKYQIKTVHFMKKSASAEENSTSNKPQMSREHFHHENVNDKKGDHE